MGLEILKINWAYIISFVWEINHLISWTINICYPIFKGVYLEIFPASTRISLTILFMWGFHWSSPLFFHILPLVLLFKTALKINNLVLCLTIESKLNEALVFYKKAYHHLINQINNFELFSPKYFIPSQTVDLRAAYKNGYHS